MGSKICRPVSPTVALQPRIEPKLSPYAFVPNVLPGRLYGCATNQTAPQPIRHGPHRWPRIRARPRRGQSGSPRRPRPPPTDTRIAPQSAPPRSLTSSYCTSKNKKPAPRFTSIIEVKKHGRLFQSTIELSNTQSMPENTCMRQEGPAAEPGPSPVSKRVPRTDCL